MRSVIPGTLPDDVRSVIDKSFSSAVLATDLHELLEGGVVSIVVISVVIEEGSRVRRHHEADCFRHLSNYYHSTQTPIINNNQDIQIPLPSIR